MPEYATPDLWGTSDPIEGDETDEVGTFNTNYIKYFWNLKKENEIDCNNIIDLYIPFIDRGIRNFIDFANVLKDTLPNLKELYIEQNYCPRHDTVDEFLEFLNILQLDKITFIDHQSSFIKDLTEEIILSVVPKGSKYFIKNGLSIRKEIISNNYDL